jgi:exosortase/archaeosortase family protein
MNKKFIQYVLTFILIFCVLYYGTIAMIGITTSGGYYNEFAANYLNYVAGLRWVLLHSSKIVLNTIGFDVYLKDIYTIRQAGGAGVHVGYDCIGYGVLFFWVAFIVANSGSILKKIKWIAGGLCIIECVNIIRISLMVIAVNKKWLLPFKLDNHTLYNIVAYLVVFSMIYFFDKVNKT